MSGKKELVNLNIRIPDTLKKELDQVVQNSVYTNQSEFVRDAIREKIQRSRT